MYKTFINIALFVSLTSGHRNAHMKKTSLDSTTSNTSTISLREQRNAKIRLYYTTQFGKGLRTAVIIKALSNQWCLAEDTIERIVFQRGRYRTTSAHSVSSTTQTAQA